MPGHLSQHPYYKSFDELQRTSKRMKTYSEMHITDNIEHAKVEKLIKLVDEAVTYIPREYKLTKHQLKTKKRK